MAATSYEIPFRQTVGPLVIASWASVLVQIMYAVLFQTIRPLGVGFLIVVLWSWGLSLAAGVLFVIPILALVPRLRKPSLWVAAIWGAVVSWLFSGVVFRRVYVMSSPIALIGIGSAGAAAGLLYAVLVKRNHGRTPLSQ